MGLFKNIFRILGRIYISVRYLNSKSWRKYYAQKHLKDVCGKIYKKQFKDEFDILFKKSEINNRNSLIVKFDYWLCFVLLGANPENYFDFYFFSKDWTDRRKHVTQFDLSFFDKWLNDEKERSLLDNKAEFNVYFNDFIKRKWCVPDRITESDFVELFKDVDKVIVKNQTGLGGYGIQILQLDDIQNIYEVLSSFKYPVIVEEYINQEGLLHDFNPSSLNTIRVTTIRFGNEVNICHALLRVGARGSIVDNFHSGGIQFLLDDTGRILQGNTCERFAITHHPDSGIPITGQFIPKWHEIMDFVCRAHLRAPDGLRLIGWDVCLNGDEISLIEGNNGPGFPPIRNSEDDHWKEMSSFMDKIFS